MPGCRVDSKATGSTGHHPVRSATPAWAAPARPATNARQFELGFDSQVEYDTNLPRSSAAEAKLRNLVQEDVAYSPNARLNLRLPIGRQAFFFNGSGGYVFHDSNTRLDSERLNVTSGFDTRLGPCQNRLAGSYQRSLADLQNVNLASAVTDKVEVKRAGIDIQCSRPTGVGVTFSASEDWNDHSLAQVAQQDSRGENYSTGLNYSRPALGTLTLFGSYGRTKFPHRPAVGGQEQGYEVTAGGMTYDRHLGARIEGTVSVSYSEVSQLAVDPRFPVSDFSGLLPALLNK